MKHDYYGVQKVKWDQMWHALYIAKNYYTKKPYETYDRVSKEEAMKILQKLKIQNETMDIQSVRAM